MRTVATTTPAALVQLLHIVHPAGVLALNTSTWDLTWAGVVYRGAYGLGSISAVTDQPGQVQGLTFTLSGISADRVALALDDAAQWQGVPITIRTALLNDAYQVVDAPVEWTGRGDTMQLDEDGETCTIGASAESSAVDLLRGHPLSYSDADQQALYPGDRGFEYVASQADQRVVWPARQWFFK
jgi:hypothetical protein